MPLKTLLSPLLLPSDYPMAPTGSRPALAFGQRSACADLKGVSVETNTRREVPGKADFQSAPTGSRPVWAFGQQSACADL
ncbi:MAG: hypothetical protein N3B68_11205 [Anaerolineae bacterium]|nr:hypothetical protein [Anaerolineae bacterium]